MSDNDKNDKKPELFVKIDEDDLDTLFEDADASLNNAGRRSMITIKSTPTAIDNLRRSASVVSVPTKKGLKTKSSSNVLKEGLDAEVQSHSPPQSPLLKVRVSKINSETNDSVIENPEISHTYSLRNVNSFLIPDHKDQTGSMISERSEAEGSNTKRGSSPQNLHRNMSFAQKKHSIIKQTLDRHKSVSGRKSFKGNSFFYKSEKEEEKKMSKEEKLEYLLSKPLDKRSVDDVVFMRENTSNVQLFEKLTKDQRDMVCAMLKVQVYQPEDLIIKEGDFGDIFFIILTGSVEVLKKIVEKKKNGVNVASNKRVAMLSPGQSFGELALIRSAPRACTCKALVRTACATLNKAEYNTIMMQSETEELSTKINILRKSSLFDSCTDKELTYFSYFFQKKRYGRGNVMQTQGKPSDSSKLYIILRGQCQIVAKSEGVMNEDENNDQYEEMQTIPMTVSTMNKPSKQTPLQTQRCEANFQDKNSHDSLVLSTLVEGQYFGDSYLFNTEPLFCETIVASTELYCYVITKEDFKSRLRPSIIQNVRRVSLLKKKWRAKRTEFLVHNPIPKTVYANLKSTIKNPFLPTMDNPGIRNFEMIKKPKKKVLFKLHRNEDLIPVKSITSGSQIVMQSLVEPKKNVLKVPKDVKSTPWDELKRLDTNNVLESHPEFCTGLPSVSASKKYAHLFSSHSESSLFDNNYDNNNNNNNMYPQRSNNQEEDEDGGGGTLYRSLGVWRESKLH